MSSFTLPTRVVTLLALLTTPTFQAYSAPDQKTSVQSKWKLVWQDEFSGQKIDSRYWSKCVRTKSDWANTLTDDPALYVQREGILRLRGVKNHNTKKDASPYLTAGITSKGKYSFTYGKVQIRARFKGAQGAWPALWMMGEKGRWPANGEIDLMERLNFDRKVHQTVHSPYTKDKSKKTPASGTTTAIKPNDWNTYGCEWNADKIIFTINGKPTHHYPRLPEKGTDQWPFKQPFYLILSMQIGGNWVNAKHHGGATNPDHYPAWLEVDWVRVYQKTNS